MSHFCVLVIGDELENQLQPYHEYECTGIKDEHVVFVDHTDEVKEEFENETRTMIKVGDEWKSPYDDIFYRPATVEEQAKIGNTMGGMGCANGFSYMTKTVEGARVLCVKDTTGLVEQDVPYSELYDDHLAFARDYHEYEIQGDRCGRVTNPNAKWDWWVIGGRWTGELKGKPGVSGNVGHPGLMTPKARDGWFDSLRKGDVDLEGMRADAAAKANEQYDKFAAATEGLEPPAMTFAELKEFEKQQRGDEGHIERARATYREHPWHNALRESDLARFMGCDIEHWCVRTGGRDEFVRRAVSAVLVPFAVVMDGKWYQRGEMGWWACVSDEVDADEWAGQVASLLNDVSDDTLLTYVDCHI